MRFREKTTLQAVRRTWRISISYEPISANKGHAAMTARHRRLSLRHVSGQARNVSAPRMIRRPQQARV